jgi:6-phosphogluconolactonase
VTLPVEVCADAEAAALRGAGLLAEEVTAAIAARGACALAVSGGRAPWRMFELLGEHPLDWTSVEVFQVDERVAPDGDSDRNLTHLYASLPAAAAQSVRPMPVTENDLEAAADRYAAALPPALDLVHLGLGPDGHAASLVPGDPVLEEAERLVATAGPYQDRRRMTLTYPALAMARRIVWLVTGADKREALRKLVAGDPSIPAGRVSSASATAVVSREAT